MTKFVPTSVSQMPHHNGDGYAYGGDWIVTIGDQSLNLGAGRKAQELACLLHAAPEMLAAAKDALAGWRYIREHHGDLYGVGWDRVEEALSTAIDKAERAEP